jgi:hypothetical protein
MAGLRLAAPLVRRLNFDLDDPQQAQAMSDALAVAAPYVESVDVLAQRGAAFDWPCLADAARPALASAARLTDLFFCEGYFTAPCRLPGEAWACAARLGSLVRVLPDPPGADHRFLFFEGPTEAALTAIAAAAAPAAQIARITGLVLTDESNVEAVLEAGHGLTHLSALAGGEAFPRLLALAARLPVLTELAVCDSDARPHTVDLRALNSPSLQRLAVLSNDVQGVEVSIAMAGRLKDLALWGLLSPDPPGALRGGRFTRLTRLQHCHNVAGSPVNLGPWGDPDSFFIPTLETLVVWGRAYTLGGRDGRAWAAAVARSTLPRLTVLSLQDVQAPPPRVRFACRTPEQTGQRRFGPTQCLGCGAEGGCAGGNAVGHALLSTLPAAYAEAGRRLRLWPEKMDFFHRFWDQFTLRFEAAPPQD